MNLTPEQEKIVAKARKYADERAKGYRDQALKLYPWVCGRCSREFNHANLRELTVHHRNHDHDYNPPDGSNWELLCLYCNDYEHQKLLEAAYGGAAGNSGQAPKATHNPFADLKERMKKN